MLGMSWIGIGGALLMLGNVSTAFACRCAEPPPATAYARAQAVVQGSVKKVIPAPEGVGGTAIVCVSRAWKTDVPAELAVTTVTDCAYPWAENEQYVLFLVRDSNGLYSTARCLGNHRIEDRTRLQWLDAHGQSARVKPVRATAKPKRK